MHKTSVFVYEDPGREHGELSSRRRHFQVRQFVSNRTHAQRHAEGIARLKNQTRWFSDFTTYGSRNVQLPNFKQFLQRDR